MKSNYPEGAWSDVTAPYNQKDAELELEVTLKVRVGRRLTDAEALLEVAQRLNGLFHGQSVEGLRLDFELVEKEV